MNEQVVEKKDIDKIDELSNESVDELSDGLDNNENSNKKEKRRKMAILVSTVSGIVAFAIILLILLTILVPTRSPWPGLSTGFQETMLMPNSQVENDNGFNSLLLTGGSDYAIEYEEYYGEKYYIGKITPTELDNTTEYRNNIIMAYDNGAESIITAGYNVLNALLGPVQEDGSRENSGVMFYEEYSDKFFVVIDDNDYEGSIARNVISFSFDSGEAGFTAGVSAAVWATATQTYVVGTFGGIIIPSVYSFLSGFEQGVNWFNYAFLGYDVYGNQTNPNYVLQDTIYDDEYVKITNGLDDYMDYSGGSDGVITQDENNPNNWYTNSFNAGEGTQKSVAQIDDGASVLFPVAGAQTGDAIYQAEVHNDSSNDYYDVKVIGVDTDATVAYPNNADEILGSATKDVYEATKLSIWYVDTYIIEYNQDITNSPQWDTTTGDWDVNAKEYKDGKTFDEYYYDSLAAWQDTESANIDFSQMSQAEIDAYLTEYYSGNAPENAVPLVEGLTAEDYYNLGYYGVDDNGNEIETLEYGAVFSGTFENGGVSFISEDSLEEALDVLLLAAGVPESNLDSINMDQIFQIGFAANPIIEESSKTFCFDDNQDTDGASVPWIPDWTLYQY